MQQITYTPWTEVYSYLEDQVGEESQQMLAVIRSQSYQPACIQDLEDITQKIFGQDKISLTSGLVKLDQILKSEGEDTDTDIKQIIDHPAAIAIRLLDILASTQDEYFRYLICKIFCNIATSDEGAQHLLELQIDRKMIDLLRESGDKFVLEGAIWCLQNFALESTETRDRLISADYVPAIVGVYQRAKDSSVGEEFLIDLVESSKQLWSSEPVAELERVIPIFKMLAEEFH